MMTRGNISPLEGGHNPEMIQQPRRFACDRCRMQKLRCERDIWRPSLMPCKRCRKARMACTISSMDRSVSKRPKEKVVTPSKVSKTTKESPKHVQGKSPSLNFPEQTPEEAAIAYHNKMMAGGFALTTPSHMNPDSLHPEDCFATNASFDSYTVPIFSGLITPPSMDSERGQLPLQLSTYLPQNQDWASLSDSQGVEYEDKFPCLDDREQHWDRENLRRLLETNTHLLDCQQMISQKLIMLGNMSPSIAVNNLETALQSVLGYSQQFLEVVKFSVPGDLPELSCHLSNTVPATSMALSLPTPSESRRSSFFQAATGCEMALAQPEALPQQINPTYIRQGRFDDVHTSLILAIVNCYTCLAGSYHLIFTYLLQELMASSPQPSPIFPNFGFATESEPNRDLQLRLIFNNSMGMLAHVETSLGLPERHAASCLSGQPHHQDGILSHPSALVLLDGLASQGFGLCVNGLATGKQPLKEIVQAINQFLALPDTLPENCQ
ncbi:hypothetical protein BGW36DRAFT_400618 [Talaromyces proteolyticus]|uniref:Zn(2)-C6 fungal-type domain-containing protein n=1 Tax=Talaromyces proteolyticus TaxID=1131652 RepID=A0AAD4PVY4_9EURO|nr:uncharacterized protein BGW36DRAFT_400618 [Talaromyces proteolyticus]KAH8691312.1 hypothetical protein BGW36DRAFT_400618 [Talaromyces proteolyticus]